MFGAARSAGSVARERLRALSLQNDERSTAAPGRHAITPEDAPPSRVGLDVSAARAVLALGVAAVVGGAAVLLVGWPRTSSTEASTEGHRHSSKNNVLVSHPPSSASRVVVDVDGAVRRPGVVTLPSGSRVIDAIERAGGATGRADTGTLNLAQILVDGEQIIVSRAGSGGAGAVSAVPTSPAGAPSTSGAIVNINTAAEAELDTLPGIGPVLAAAIVQWRTDNGGFTSVEQLQEVSGIGPATYADIASLVRI